MKRTHLFAGGWMATALLASEVAEPQARGPSATVVLEKGQEIPNSRQERLEALERSQQEAQALAEQEAEELKDPAIRARKFAELEAWLRRIPGRFRIEGLIEKPEFRLEAQASTVVDGKVTGVADCRAIGEGVGVHCILNATWPIIESGAAPLYIPGIGTPPPPASEMLRTFSPAILLIGMSQDPPGIQAEMVNADSLSHAWAGKLVDDTATGKRLNRAMFLRSFHPLQIIAPADSDAVTIVLRSGTLTLTLAMHRDDEAQAEVPVKPLPSR
jgi:hypothetical protein